MIYALASLIFTAVICYLLSFSLKTGSAARIVALAGAGVSLAVASYQEALQGTGATIKWPDFLSWLGASFYKSDTLAASMGAWCILLGGLCLVRLGEGERAPRQLAAATLAIATLYSLIYTVGLQAFAVQLLLLVLLTWAIQWDGDGRAEFVIRQRVAQTVGTLALLGAVLVVGRTTGGVYSLDELSLAAVTFWPLLLIVLFVLCWLGLAPIIGWSGLVDGNRVRGTQGALVQGLVLGVPVVVLVLR